jgi:hypothetical protein
MVQTGGDDGDPDYLNSLANQLQANLDASDVSAATLSAATSLAAARYSRDYEVAALHRQVNEMHTAAVQAAAETAAANARVAAANNPCRRCPAPQPRRGTEPEYLRLANAYAGHLVQDGQ